jgi:hypothetical protein
MTIELLLKNGADLHVRDVYNRSIVHWIAYTGKVYANFILFCDIRLLNIIINIT